MMLLTLVLYLATARAFSIEDVRSAIDAREVRTVDQLWRRLPHQMLSQPAIVPRSFSPVPASARLPRLLLAEDDGGLFAAAGTKRRHSSYGRLELAAADPVSAELSLYLVDFRREPVLTRNPRECLGCHMVHGTIRLRVEPYPHWPGWFGHQERMDEERSSRLSERETRATVQFILHQRHVPRLARPFEDGFHFAEPVHQAATRLTVLAVRAEARAAIRRLAADPFYARVRLPLAATDDTGNQRFRELLDEDLRRDFEAYEHALKRELRENAITYSRRTNDVFNLIYGARWEHHWPKLKYRALVPFEWAFRRAGLSLAAYSTSAVPGVLNINTGLGDLADFLRQFVSDDLASEFDLTEPSWTRDPRYLALTLLPEPRRYTDEFIPAVRAKMCERGLATGPSTAATPRSAPPASSP